MIEVQLGEPAEQKAASLAVKQFGATMVKDHGSANKELQQLAQQHGVKLPIALDRDHQQTYDKLSRLSGSQFDREYMSYMVKDHKEDIALFEKQARKSDAADVKAFAEKTLPTLQEHLKMAQQAQAESAQTGISPRR
jgi:putative membrane protein